jgi:hypothetical protein
MDDLAQGLSHGTAGQSGVLLLGNPREPGLMIRVWQEAPGPLISLPLNVPCRECCPAFALASPLQTVLHLPLQLLGSGPC